MAHEDQGLLLADLFGGAVLRSTVGTDRICVIPELSGDSDLGVYD